MPGAAHMGRGQPIESRSTAGLIIMYFGVPILAGLAILTFIVVQIVNRGHELTASEWFWQVGWLGLLGLAAMTALPAAGYREFQRRKKKTDATLSR